MVAHATRVAAFVALVARATAKNGAFRDPKHYQGDDSLAGLRFCSEVSPHETKIVGTDEGVTWWAMSANDTFFGSTWTAVAAPTPAFAKSDGLDDHAGPFIDRNHFVTAASWAGLRVIAEDPPHILQMVGSDDGEPHNFWFLEGKCTGPEMTAIHFDFSPKGGPADLTGTWAPAPYRSITWPDGNAWAKVPEIFTGGHPGPSKLVQAPSATYLPGGPLALVLAAGLVLAAALHVKRASQRAARGFSRV